MSNLDQTIVYWRPAGRHRSTDAPVHHEPAWLRWALGVGIDACRGLFAFSVLVVLVDLLL